ncbi:MAG: succinate dehydrogenase assembly factor 2 [Burkholderiaceae bacterium]|nr:succinate dehydrogenase assembly factor 2 [Burkholderiaceae bacterium]
MPAGIGHQADPAQRRRLRWRARRGLLENDLILTRFLDRFEAGMSDEDVAGLDLLLDLPDNELLDLILGRTPASGDLANDPVVTVLRKLQEV